jgi:hypothetical protein
MWCPVSASLLAAAFIGIKVWDFFHGRNLLVELGQEAALMCRSLTELDAFCRRNPDRSDVIVSLTTLPSRLPLIGDTIKSLLRQTRAPAEIRLYLPRVSRRERQPYVVPAELRALKSLRICVCPEDYGPATKFLPALGALAPDAKLLVVDDDRIFQPSMLAALDDAANAEPDAAYGFGGWIVPDDLIDRATNWIMILKKRPPAQVRPAQIATRTEIDILMGAHAYLVRPRFFHLARLADFSGAPEAVYFADDIWISGHCRAPKFTLPTRLVDFQPYRHLRAYDRSSLGWLNRADVPERRMNSIMLSHFGPGPWQVGAGKRKRA